MNTHVRSIGTSMVAAIITPGSIRTRVLEPRSALLTQARENDAADWVSCQRAPRAGAARGHAVQWPGGCLHAFAFRPALRARAAGAHGHHTRCRAEPHPGVSSRSVSLEPGRAVPGRHGMGGREGAARGRDTAGDWIQGDAPGWRLADDHGARCAGRAGEAA